MDEQLDLTDTLAQAPTHLKNKDHMPGIKIPTTSLNCYPQQPPYANQYNQVQPSETTPLRTSVKAHLSLTNDPAQFQIKATQLQSKKKQKKQVQNPDSTQNAKTQKNNNQVQEQDWGAPEFHNQTKILNLQFAGTAQQSPFKDMFGQLAQYQQHQANQSYSSAMNAQRQLHNLMQVTVSSQSSSQQNFIQIAQDSFGIKTQTKVQNPSQMQQSQGPSNGMTNFSPQKRTVKPSNYPPNQTQNLIVINQIQLKNSGFQQAMQQQTMQGNQQKQQISGGMNQNAKTQSRALVSSVAPPEKGNMFTLVEENIYDPVVQLPQISSQTQPVTNSGYPRSKQKEKRKTDSQNQARRKISQTPLMSSFQNTVPEQPQTLYQKNQQVMLLPQGVVVAAPNTVKKHQSSKLPTDSKQFNFNATLGSSSNVSQQFANPQQQSQQKIKQPVQSSSVYQILPHNSSQGFQNGRTLNMPHNEDLQSNKQEQQFLIDSFNIKQTGKTKTTNRQTSGGVMQGLQFSQTNEDHHQNLVSNRDQLGELQSSNSGTLRQTITVIESSQAVNVMVIPPGRIQFQSSEHQLHMKKQNSHTSTQSVDGIVTVHKVKKHEQFTQEIGDAISQDQTNDRSDSRDDSLSVQFVKAQIRPRVELSRPARVALVSTEDLDDDEHFDDGNTDSEQTDNEMQNNLHSFKHKDMAGVNGALGDSDADSDAGNSSYRFSLSNIQPMDRANNQNSDSETDTDTQFNKRGRAAAYRDEPDDIGIDDISEHSSDEIDSDSDEVCTPMQKQIKKEKKRKKRKMEAIKKAQAAAKGDKGGQKDQKLEPKRTEKGSTNNNAKEKETGKQKKDSQATRDNNQSKKDKPKQKAPEQQVKQMKKDKEVVSQQQVVEESPMKKKKKEKAPKQNMQALVHTLPKNIEEQQEIFFLSGCSTNPQFEYDNFETTQKFLLQYKEPSEELMPMACKIMTSFLETYGSESAYLASEGDLVSQEDTERIFMDYINELEFGDQLIMNFQVRQVAPTSVTHDPKTGKSKVNIRLPCEYRQGRIMGVIDHEIGTHFLRRNNEKFQVWCKKRDKYEVKNCMKTEEGFACTNQLVRQALQPDGFPYLYRSALNYYTAYKASKMGFVDLFNDIEKYIDDKMSRWKFILRVKRGLMDTSKPGGLYKDQVYLEGAVAILRERKTLDFYGLCCGKISLEDMKRLGAQKKLKKEQIKIPPFMRDMDQYMRALDIIARVNHIDDYNEQYQRQGAFNYNNDLSPKYMKTLQVADDFDDGSDDFE